jgi:hypothetical protein
MSGWLMLSALSSPRVTVFSVSNDNQHFHAHLEARWRWFRDSVSLEVGGQRLRGSWSDGGAGPSWASFVLDEAQAQEVAERYGVPVRRRAPLGEQIHAAWSAHGTTVHLRLDNAGEPVGLWVNGVPTADSGGMGQLTFRVLQDGVPLPPRAPTGAYVGPVAVRSLGPGSPLELQADLSPLFVLQAGASYEIECRYDGLVVGTQGLPAYPAQAHLAWAVHFEDTLRLDL